MVKNMIELINISKTIKDGSANRDILGNVNLIINDGDYITIKGESGSGKSTLLNIMSLLLKPTTGTVKINGHEAYFGKEEQLSQLRGENMGLVFQNPNLISCLNAMDNIILASRSKHPHDSKERAKELLESVGMKDKMRSSIKSLSGGEAQRIAIVRAMINSPNILLCDEPTGALDKENTDKVISLIENVYEKNGCSLVIVTHDEKIWQRGKRRIILERGLINEIC
jgi:ABC-type lipoprotein export system ATPase subunit